MSWDLEISIFNLHCLFLQKKVDKIFAMALCEMYHKYPEPRYDAIYREGLKWLVSL